MLFTADKPLDIFVDGSCPRPNEVGGWAFIILHPTEHLMSSGHIIRANSMQMEMWAALYALREIKAQGWRELHIRITSDNMTVVQGMNNWRHDWAIKEYDGVKNVDLWRRLASHGDRCPNLTFRWVKGHSGNEWNEWCDKAADKARRKGFATAG